MIYLNLYTLYRFYSIRLVIETENVSQFLIYLCFKPKNIRR
jgi:hypothetical protein